nr:hypothetical protein [uncultured Bacillus sp.]
MITSNGSSDRKVIGENNMRMITRDSSSFKQSLNKRGVKVSE